MNKTFNIYCDESTHMVMTVIPTCFWMYKYSIHTNPHGKTDAIKILRRSTAIVMS